MTTVASGVTPVVSGTTPLPASAASATDGTLAGNFQTFLTLLTTQLQNQNPLDPLDTNQFTQQLVQFAGVEQQLKTNDQLTALVALQQTAQTTQALTFVGKTAMVDGKTTSLTNGAANWILGVKADSTVQVSIAGANGQTVFHGSYPVKAGDGQAFGWDGKGDDGTQWPDGKYTISVTGTDSSGNAVDVSTEVVGTVNSVDLTQTPPLLSIGGQNYTISQVKGIAS
jgi:flagellar basal-body rod modification protein FlgD